MELQTMIKNEPSFRNRLRCTSLALLGSALLLAGGCLTMYWKQVEQQDYERQFVAAKVSMVMNLFGSHDPEIHAALMETFDPVLVAILVGIESEYQANAVSPKGCVGLMQLTPDKLTDWRDKRQNIRVGAEYLKSMLERFGSMELAIAAYNAGPDAVIRYGGVPPFAETRRYVERARRFGSMVEHAICYESGIFDQTRRLAKRRAAL